MFGQRSKVICEPDKAIAVPTSAWLDFTSILNELAGFDSTGWEVGPPAGDALRHMMTRKGAPTG